MSTLTEEGVMGVKTTACDRLLAFRVDSKLAGKRISDVLNRMHVALPKVRNPDARPPVIPPSVLAARAASAGAAGKAQRKLEKDLQEENGGAGGALGGRSLVGAVLHTAVEAGCVCCLIAAALPDAHPPFSPVCCCLSAPAHTRQVCTALTCASTMTCATPRGAMTSSQSWWTATTWQVREDGGS